MDKFVNSLNDPNAAPYTGDDPIVRARLGLPPIESGSSDTTTSSSSLSASSVASGLNNLPGGAGAVSSITNLSTGSLPNLPGAGALTGVIGNVSATSMTGITDFKNALSSSGVDIATGKVASIEKAFASGGIGGALGSLSSLTGSVTGSLSSLMTKGLPAGLSSQLQSAMGSIASAGSGIKIPSVAIGTTNTVNIEAASVAQLGDPSIPPPDYGNYTDSEKQSNADKLATYKQKVAVKQAEIEQQMAVFRQAKLDYENAKNNLPAGDPTIEQLKKTALQELTKVAAINTETATLRI